MGWGGYTSSLLLCYSRPVEDDHYVQRSDGGGGGVAATGYATLTLFPQILLPSSSFTASAASRASSINTNANPANSQCRHWTDLEMSSQRTTDCDLPGGFLAIHTFLTAPNGVNASSSSYLVASLPRSPMYTCIVYEISCVDCWNVLLAGYLLN